MVCPEPLSYYGSVGGISCSQSACQSSPNPNISSREQKELKYSMQLTIRSRRSTEYARRTVLSIFLILQKLYPNLFLWWQNTLCFLRYSTKIVEKVGSGIRGAVVKFGTKYILFILEVTNLRESMILLDCGSLQNIESMTLTYSVLRVDVIVICTDTLPFIFSWPKFEFDDDRHADTENDTRSTPSLYDGLGHT